MGLLLKPRRGNGILIGKGEDAVLLQFARVRGEVAFNFHALDHVPLTRLTPDEVDSLVSSVSSDEVDRLIQMLQAAKKERAARKSNPKKPEVEVA